MVNGAAVVELWREPKVLQTVGLSRASVWKMVKSGEFPAPIHLRDGGRAVAWQSDLVAQWVQQRIERATAERRAA